MRFLYFFFIASFAIAGDFTTSLGDAYPHIISAVTTDSAGNTYVVGSRIVASSTDVFVSKLDPNGNILFTDTFAGKGMDTGIAIILDPSGNIYIAGTTSSPDFPLSQALQTQSSIYGFGIGFIIKLTNDGTTILYSTYFGGSQGQSVINALATDAKGNLYVTGSTDSSDFPQKSGLPTVALNGVGYDEFATIIAEISAAGDKILYSGAIAETDNGGAGSDGATGGIGIAVDGAGNAYIAGNTTNPDLPTTTGVLSPQGNGAFVAKVNAGGGGVGYLTYIGSEANILNAIAVDATGNVYLGGQSAMTGAAFAILAKLNPTGSAMLWASSLVGIVQSIAVDASGSVWATGTTASSTFPNANGWTTGPEFLVGLNAAGSELTYSALFPTGTVAQSVAVDSSGFVHTAGYNGFVSAVNPTSARAMEVFALQNGFGENLTARIAPAEVITIWGPGIGPATPATATRASGFYPTTLGGVRVIINGSNIPLLYVSANQINAVAPIELAVDAPATVRVTTGTAESPAYPIWIIASAPVANPTVLNQDGTINSEANPAAGGSIVTFWVTGWQPSFSPLADGQVASVANDVCHESCQASATAPGYGFMASAISLTAEVLYGGSSPSIVAGVTQLNVQLGTPSTKGLFDLTVTGGNAFPAIVSQEVAIGP